MSIKAMTFVWEHSTQKSTNLLLLLAIADHCDDEGIAFPSIGRLAKKCRLGHRGTQLCIQKLVKADELEVVVSGHLSRGATTNLFFLKQYRNFYKLSSPPVDKQDEQQFMEQDKPKPKRKNTAKKPLIMATDEPQFMGGDEPQFMGGDEPQFIQNHHTNYQLQPSGKNVIVVAVDNSLSEEQKACWEWAKKHNHWSSFVYSKAAFLKHYNSESGALRGQYENWLELNKTEEAKKIKPKVPEVWERQGFKSEKEYNDFMFRKQTEKYTKNKTGSSAKGI